jgi:D-glycero-alpha-D-manno-heptose-7-phosphate kinase
LAKLIGFMMRKRIIQVTTPTRIDLAGGTLDLYPIYLFEDGGLTINCAIDQYCTVRIEERGDKKIALKSVDLAIEEEYQDIASISTNGPLNLISRAVRYFHPEIGLTITAENRVRKGSGLGGSSSLLIAVLQALNILTDAGFTPDHLIDLAANLEAQSIGIPTGKQDYFAAVFGGVNGLWFELYENRREQLLSAKDFQELEKRLILSFTGAPRFSGASNWNMMKNYIDKKPKTLKGMKGIKEIALAMRSCILRRDWDEFASLVEREWQHRRRLAKGVSNESVEKIISAALDAGAMANKLCGAGGGGCMITCVRPEGRTNVEAALTSSGAEVLPFKLVQEGMKVQNLDNGE